MKEEQTFIGGLKINYKVAGEGPAILILHGWESKSDRWEAVGHQLTQNNFKVFVPDLPGFGKSDKPSQPWNINDFCNFVLEFNKKIGINNFYLLGHSFGGGISARLTSRYPKKIIQLFLIASACLRKEDHKKTLFKNLSKALKGLSFLPFYKLMRKIFYRILLKSDYISISDETKRKTFINIISEDLTQDLKNINLPTVIIWGKKDDVLPISQGRTINQLIKGSKMIEISEGDHDLERNMPDTLYKEIIKNICL